MTNSLTTSVISIVPVIPMLLLGGLITTYADHTNLTPCLALIIYATGLGIGFLMIPAMYHAADLAKRDPTPPQTLQIPGKTLRMTRVCLLLILLAILLISGIYLQTGFAEFSKHTYLLYGTGVILGICAACLTFEFNSAVDEMRKYLGKP